MPCEGWFLVHVVVRDLLERPKSAALRLMLALSVVSCLRLPLALHGLCGTLGWTYPLSEYAFRCVDSLNSTLTLSLAFVYCCWKAAQGRISRF